MLFTLRFLAALGHLPEKTFRGLETGYSADVTTEPLIFELV